MKMATHFVRASLTFKLRVHGMGARRAGLGCAAKCAIFRPRRNTLSPPCPPWVKQPAGENGNTFRVSGACGHSHGGCGSSAQRCEKAGMGFGVIRVHLGRLATTRSNFTPLQSSGRAHHHLLGTKFGHHNRPKGQTSTTPRPQHPLGVCPRWCGSIGAVRGRVRAPAGKTCLC